MTWQCTSTTDVCPFCQLAFCLPICPTGPGSGGTGNGPIGGGYNWPPDPPIGAPTGGGGGSTTPPTTGGNCRGTNNCGTGGSVIVEGRVPCGGCGEPPVVVILPDEPPTQPPLSDTCEELQNMGKSFDSLYIKGKVDSMLNTFIG